MASPSQIRFLGWFLLLAALASACGGFFSGRAESHLRANGTRVMGTVVDREVDTSGKTDDYILTVKYSTLGVEARKAFFVPYRVYVRHHISSEIEVIYDQLNPQNVEVVPDLGSQPTMFFIASGLTSLGCIGAFYWARRLRREDAEPEIKDLDAALRKARRR